MPCLWLDSLSWQAALSLQLLAACLMELLDAASATVISFLAFPCLVVVLSESPHLEPVLFSSSALEPLTLGSGLAWTVVLHVSYCYDMHKCYSCKCQIPEHPTAVTWLVNESWCIMTCNLTLSVVNPEQCDVMAVTAQLHHNQHHHQHSSIAEDCNVLCLDEVPGIVPCMAQ